jgi:hypothetical protein
MEKYGGSANVSKLKFIDLWVKKLKNHGVSLSFPTQEDFFSFSLQ